MDNIATLTQRGQIVIPQPIREYFGLEPADKLFFKVEEDKIVVKPILSINEAMGMIKTKKKITKKKYKEVIASQVVKKFKDK